MKQCGECKLYKDYSEYNKRGAGLQPWCRGCNRTRSRKYYADNREKHLKVIGINKKRVITENLRKFQEIKSKCSCAANDCFEREPICLDFHHLEDKDSEIIKGLYHGWSWNRIVREMKKCIVICSNCHRKLHAGLIVIDESKRWKE